MSPVIYLVDDEPLLMELLGQYVKKSKKSWNIVCFSEPEKALKAASENRPDIVISDFAMPDMIGTVLLEKIRLTAPNTIRILVSGYADPSALGDKLCSAHQYLAKPFSLADVCSIIQKALNALNNFHSEAVCSTVLSIRTLPALPHIYYRLLSALEDPQCSYLEVVEILKKDEAICAKVLHMANSPLFCNSARGQSITDLLQAITVLGTERTKAAVLSHQLFGSYSGIPEYFMPMTLSQHRWQTADLSFQIAKEMGVPEEVARDAYVVGLMHDMGRLVLVENFHAQYDEICQKVLNEKKPLSAAEQEAFKVSQADIIGFLASLWGMRDTISQGLTFQERPWDAPTPEIVKTATAVYLAHYKAHQLHPSEKFEQPPINLDFLKSEGLLSLVEKK